ncbi:MAG: bile acid:sodium symporter family protein [Bacteroidales bacterium]|nr:bile acid:sodium symporter family protein [Bacteroidales bacterium]
MNRILHFFNKWIALWVALFGFIAYIYPQIFNFFGPFINVFFGIAMFGIGLVIREQDYKNIIRTPGAIVFGTICQFTIMPLLALLTSWIFKLSPAWTLGLILTGSAPGAMTSNIISYLSKGDVAYSVSLTALSTLLCPVLTPLLTLVLAGTKVPISFWPMFQTIIWVVVVPLLAGFLFRKALPKQVEKLGELPSTFSVLAVLVITSYVIAANRDSLGLATLGLLTVVAFHNGMGMLLGFFAGIAAKLSFVRRKTLSIEVGMQNAGLGVVLALKHFGKEVAIPAAIFTIWCIFTASLLVYVWDFIDARKTIKNSR